MPSAGSPQMTNFPQGFAAGLLLRGLPILQSNPGQIFWLDNSPVLERGSVQGSDNNRGTFYRPFASLSGALLQCAPGAGDIIMVKPGHAETISSATALNCNISDVAVIGMGSGTNRPLFTLDTANTSTITISANNFSFQNCQFVANFLNIAALFTLAAASVTGSMVNGVLNVSAVASGTLYVGNTLTGTGVPANTVILGQLTGTTGGIGTYTVSSLATVASAALTSISKFFALDNCEVRDTSAILNFLNLIATTTIDNAHDGVSITRTNALLLATTGVVTLIQPLGNLDRMFISDNYFTSRTTNAGAVIPIAGGKVLTNLLMTGRNRWNVVNVAGTATGILITTNGSTNSGYLDGNVFHTSGVTGTVLLVTTTSGFRFGLNYITHAADSSGFLSPTAGT
jgi:hypothetical protein